MLLISCGKASNHQNVYYLSAYNIFGFILKCYQVCEKAGKNQKRILQQIQTFLGRFMDDYIKANDMPTWGRAFPVPQDCADIRLHSIPPKVREHYILKMSHAILRWYTECLIFPSLCSFELGQAADGIYRHICNICNSLLADTINNKSPQGSTTLLDIFRHMVSHLPDKAAATNKLTNSEEPSLLTHQLATFPLCNNPRKLGAQIRDAARKAEKPVLATVNVPSILTVLNKELSESKVELEELANKIKAYFPRFRSSNMPAPSSQTFLFCNNTEKTREEGQNIHHYFSRINETLSNMYNAIMRRAREGASTMKSSRDNFSLLCHGLRIEMRQYREEKTRMVVFRHDIHQAFMQELQTEIANEQANFLSKRMKLRQSLESIYQKLRQSTKADSVRKDIINGSVKPSVLKNSARSPMRLFVNWKNNQAETIELEDSANQWIDDYLNNIYMKSLCSELRIKPSDFEQAFAGYRRDVVREPGYTHYTIEEHFKKYAEHLATNLKQLDSALEDSLLGYLSRIEDSAPSRRDATMGKILTEIEKMEISLSSLQDLLTLDIDIESVLRTSLHPKAQANFEAEFNLREHFYDVYITLYTLQRRIAYSRRVNTAIQS